MTAEELTKWVKRTFGQVQCGVTIGDGWAPIVHACLQVMHNLAPGEVYVSQIKEKFGGLRLYWSTVMQIDDVRARTMQALVDDAETQCWSICEDCGAPGRKATIGRGWMRTVCEPCEAAANARMVWP